MRLHRLSLAAPLAALVTLAATAHALDDFDPLEGGGGDPAENQGGAPPAAPSWPSPELAQIMNAANFTATDPAKWTAAKWDAICKIYAGNVVKRFGQTAYHGPAYLACLARHEVDLGMANFQTEEMRRAGFTPTNPRGWSYARRAEICQGPKLDAYAKLREVTLGYLAWGAAGDVEQWCASFGTQGVLSLEREPPTGWDYARWEFDWWKKQLGN